MQTNFKPPLLLFILIDILIFTSLGYYFFIEKPQQEKAGSNANINQQLNPPEIEGDFSTSTEGLPEAKPSEIIELKTGDTFNLSADIVRKDINGRRVKMLGYNGEIPGPTLKMPQGSEVKVHFTNHTDVETTIHPHGLRLDAKYDGNPHISQEPIKPGESFDYIFRFPDAGIYWYHPHIREDYTQELGMYGNFVVTPAEPDYWSPVNREVPLFIDDILLDENGIAAFNKKTSDHTMMGRFGTTMLVNGKTDYKLEVAQGEVVRFYLTNSANSRTFNVTIPGITMKLVGGDNGKYEHETLVDHVILSPSERIVVEVFFNNSGNYRLENNTPESKYTLGNIEVMPSPGPSSYENEFYTLRNNQDVISDIDSFRPSFDKIPDKTLKLTATSKMMNHNMGMMMHSSIASNENELSGIEWEDSMGMMGMMMDSQIKWQIVDEATGKANMAIDWAFKVGDQVKIRIVNDQQSAHPMQHPIHFHGQRFVVLSRNGVKNTNLIWKDTALIRTGETVDILIDMSNSGNWMTHCHIAEHLENGMQFMFRVNIP